MARAGADVSRGAAVRLPDAPPIPGLEFRHWRGPADIPEMVRVCQAARDADGDTQSESVEGMSNRLANLTNGDPEDDLLIAEVAGLMVAFSRTDWNDQNDGSRSYELWGYVDPTWRRRGIGRPMLYHGERRLRLLAAEHGFLGTRWLTTFGEDPNVGNAALLTSEGYAPVRHWYVMARPDLDAVEDVPLPPGLEVRPVRDEDLRALFLADAEAFRDHFGGIDASDAAFRRWTKGPDFDPSLFVVAWDGDEIAGGVINAIDRAANEHMGYLRGLLDSVFTRRPWRRRGLAQALIARSLVLLRERGMTAAELGVDTQNPHQATHLYEEAGFQVEHSGTVWRKALEVDAPA